MQSSQFEIETKTQMNKGFLQKMLFAAHTHKNLVLAGVFVLLAIASTAIFVGSAHEANAGSSTIITTNNTGSGLAGGQRKIVRTNNGANGNRTFALAFGGTNTNLYYTDNPDDSSPSWTNAGTVTSTSTHYNGSMVWDQTNNVLYLAYGRFVSADSNASDVFYRRVTALDSTPVLGTQRIALDATASLNYSMPYIAISGDSGTLKVLIAASGHTDSAAPARLDIRTGTINSDNPTFDTLYTAKSWTAATNAGILGIERFSSDRTVVLYYNGVDVLATMHVDSEDAQATTGWNDMAGTDNSATTVSSDDLQYRGAGSVASVSSSTAVWFSWMDSVHDVNTRRWNGSSLDTEMVPVAHTSTANTGPSLGTDGTTVWLAYQKPSDSSVVEFQTRSFTDGTTAWSGTVTTLFDSSSTTVSYPNIAEDLSSAGGIFGIFTQSAGTSEVVYAKYDAPINISGTCRTYIDDANCSSGTIRVAFDGNLQAQTTTASGSWTITGVAKPSTNQIITVFIQGVGDSDEAVAVTKYNGSGNIGGIKLFKETLSIGSDQNNTITTFNLGVYDQSVDPGEDVFHESGSSNYACNGSRAMTGLCVDYLGQSSQDRLYIDSGDTYAPTTGVSAAKIDIDGTLTGAASQEVILTGGGTSAVCDSGTNQMPLCVSGTYTANGNTVFTSTSATTIRTATYAASVLLFPDSGSPTYSLQTGAGTLTAVGLSNNGAIFDAVSTNVTLGNSGISPDISMLSGELKAGSGTWTLGNTTGQAISVFAGTFTADTSTFNFTGANAGGNVTIAALTFYNLTFTIPSETINVGGNVTVLNNLTINNGIFTPGANTITIGGNFDNNDFFDETSSTIVFNDNTKPSTISGAQGFNNITVNTPGKDLLFQAGETFTVTGTITLNGDSSPGGLVTLDSTNAAGSQPWTIYHQGASESITYTSVSWSSCHASSNLITMGVGSSKSNSGTCWDPPVVITIGGTVYSDQGSTNIGANKTVTLKVNGAGSYTDETDASGVYSIANVAAGSGTVITVFLEAETENATTVTISGGSNISDLDLYKDTLIVRYETGSNIGNNQLNQYDDGNDSGTGDVVFDVDASNNLVVQDGSKLLVAATKSFTPGGNVTTSPSNSGTNSVMDGDVEVGLFSTIDMTGYILSVGGDLTFGIASTYVSTTVDEVKFTATASGHELDFNGQTMAYITFDGVSGGWTLTNTLYALGIFTINNGTVTGPSSMSVAGFINNGTFLHNNGTVVIEGGTLGGVLSGANGKLNSLMITTATAVVTSSLEVVLDLIIMNNGGLEMNGATLTIGRHLSLDELTGFSFTSNNTVIFNTSETSEISGSSVSGLTFTNLTVATPGKVIKFADDITFQINGVLTVTGSSGNNVVFNTISGAGNWKINHQGTENITYLTVNNSLCTAESTAITVGTGSVNGGNNGACWQGFVVDRTFSGIVQQMGGSADAVVRNLRWSKNGGASTLFQSTVTTGAFSFSAPASDNDVFFVWIDGETPKATTIVKYGASCTGSPNCTGLTLRDAAVTIYNYHTAPVTNAELALCDSDGGCADADIQYNVTSDNLTLAAGNEISLVTGNYTPGGTVTTPSASLAGGNGQSSIFMGCGTTLNMGSNALSVGGSLGGCGTFSATSGQTTTFTGTASGHVIQSEAGNLQNIVINGAGGTYTWNRDRGILGNLTVTNGTFNPSSINLSVHGNISVGAGGTWTKGTGTLTLSGTTATTIACTGSCPSFGSVVIGKTSGLGAQDKVTAASNLAFDFLTVNTANTFEGGAGGYFITMLGNNATASLVTLNGAFVPGNSNFEYQATNSNGNINISNMPYHTLRLVGDYNNAAAETFVLTGNQTGASAIAGNLDICGGCALDVILDTNNYNLEVGGVLDIGVSGPSATLSAGSSTVTLTGSGTPLQVVPGGAAFTAGTSTVVYASSTGITALSDLDMTSGNSFYNLTIDGDGGGDTFTAGVAITITNNFTVNTGDIFASAQNVTVNGNVDSSGTINHTANTFTQSNTGNKTFGGSGSLTFNNLTLSGVFGTSTAAGSGDVTVNGVMTVSSSHALVAGDKTWILNGSGTPFVNSGSINQSSGTSTFSFRGTSASNITAGTYDNIEFAPASGTPTYTLPGDTFIVNNNFTLGGAGNVTVTAAGIDVQPDISGDVIIGAGDTLVATEVNNMTVGGSWTNSGTFNPNNQTVVFDSTTTGKAITSGSSSWYGVSFSGTGGEWTLQDNISLTGILTITAGNLNASSRTITLNGSIVAPFAKSGGTFTQGTSTVVYEGGITTNILALNGTGATDAYYNLSIRLTNQPNNIPYILAGNTTVNNVVTVGGAFCDGSSTLEVSIYTLTLKGSGTPLNLTNCGRLNAGSGTVVYTSASGVTALANVPMTAASNRILGTVEINGSGNFNVTNPIEAANISVIGGTLAGNADVSIAGNVTGNGDINMTGGTFSVKGTGLFGGATDWDFYNLTFDAGKNVDTFTDGLGAVNVNNVLTLSSQLNAGDKIWNLYGTGGEPLQFGEFGVLIPDYSTFNFRAAVATNIPGTDYYNLGVIPGGNNVTHYLGTTGGQTLSVWGTATFGNGTNTGVVVNASTYNPILQFNGPATSVDIKANTTFQAPVGTTYVGGSWINSGTFTHNSGLVAFSSNSTGNTITSGGSSFNDLVLDGSGGGWSPTDTLTLAGDLTIVNGTLSGTQNVNVNGGDVVMGGTGDINMTGGTFQVDGTGNFTGTAQSLDFANLTFGDGTGVSTTTFSNSPTITVSGVMTIAANQTLTDPTASSVTLSGSGTPLVINGTYNNTGFGNVLRYTSATGVTALASAAMPAATAPFDVRINGSGTFNAGVNFAARNNFEVISGTLAMGANNLTIGNTGISSGGRLRVYSGHSITQSSTGTTTLLASGGSNCIGASGTSCTGTAGTITLGNLVLGSGSNTVATTIAGTNTTISVASITNNASNTLNAGTGTTINITGNGPTVFSNSGVFNPGTSTVNYNSAASTGTSIASLTYYNLGINRSDNTFIATPGSLSANNITLTAGTFTAPETMTISGNFSNSGSFNPNSGTVVFAPSAANNNVSLVGGSSNTTFYNLTNTTPLSTIQFGNGKIYAINGTLTATGTSGRPVRLYSDSLGAQWLIDVNGSTSLSYVAVRDAGCSSSANIPTNSRVYDLGNNDTSCWKFILRGGGNSAGGGAGSGGAGQGGGGAGGGQASSQATANATVSGGSVQSVQVTNGGAGYFTAPLVCFADNQSASETGATATAIVAGGAITSIVVNSGGSGYTASTTVVIGAPGTSGGTCSSGSGGGGAGGGGGGAAP